MIVLDTNVVSAFMQREPDRQVVAWSSSVAAESIWTTAVTVFEIRLGLELLVRGRRRRHLEEIFERSLQEEFDGRILPFDEAAAQAAGVWAAARRGIGRPTEVRDIQIAGIVVARRATLATRNVRDFEGLGLRIVNPWSL